MSRSSCKTYDRGVLRRAAEWSWLLVVVVFALVGCGSESQNLNSENSRAQLLPKLTAKTAIPNKHIREPVKWWISKVAEPNQVVIYSSNGYCDGEPPPRYAGYEILERGKKVFITAYISRLRGQPGAKNGYCRGIGYTPVGAIDLGRRVRGLELYDSSVSPSRRRWPIPAG
jgi:hypothetical protein